MNEQELQTQFKLCEQWNDADQWDALAFLYYARQYMMNATYCFRRADEIRGAAFAEAFPAQKVEDVQVYYSF
jgi:cytochrome c-type biogenesis protein CcmH/NrfG